MKKRVSRVLNFFAFNLLFFALYLNFIHKDSSSQETSAPRSVVTASKATTLVSNPEQYIQKSAASVISTASLNN